MDGLGDLGDLMTRLGTMLGRREDTHCFQCDQPDSKLKCARCRAAVYCSRACQKSHWKEHKAICNAMSSGDTDVGRQHATHLQQKAESQAAKKLMPKYLPRCGVGADGIPAFDPMQAYVANRFGPPRLTATPMRKSAVERETPAITGPFGSLKFKQVVAVLIRAPRATHGALALVCNGAIPLFPLNYCGGSDPVVLYAP